jgi:iron(III) transport system ATP-binding protein
VDISLRHLTKTFGATTVLKDVSFTIASRELFFLLGPSGCGKTTLLRLIAGFYQPDGGELSFGGRRMNDVPPHERNTGMVFQNYALWPHMTVSQNVAYGLEVRRTPKAEVASRVREALASVRMDRFADRTPNQLSGGQQQRVALARALVIRPDVLLLDEPLSNLDARLRLEMRDEIRRLHAEFQITTVYVTHDQKESLSLASRMAVMREGVVEQLADPRSVYRQPANKFVADFIGETNWFEGEIQSAGADGVLVRTGVGLWTAAPAPALAAGARVWVGFRPEAVRLSAAPSNQFQAAIRQVNYLGEIEEYVLTLGDQRFKAFEQNPETLRREGSELTVSVRPADLLLMPR